MSKRDSKKPGSLTLGLKEIKIQTGDLEDGHKDIESSMTHLQPGPGLLGRSQLWAVVWPRGAPSSDGTRPLQGQVKHFQFRRCFYQPLSSQVLSPWVGMQWIQIAGSHIDRYWVLSLFKKSCIHSSLPFSKWLSYASHPSWGEKKKKKKI